MPSATPSKRQINVWVDSEYYEWVGTIADAEGFRVSDLVRKALRDYATRNEHPAPPRKAPRGARA